MTDDIRNAPGVRGIRELEKLKWSYHNPHTFAVPTKCINEGEDVSFFLQSTAYRDIMIFMLQLNRAMFPRRNGPGGRIWAATLPQNKFETSNQVHRIRAIIYTLREYMKEAPPETGPRRFGNAAFRTWFNIVQERVPDLLQGVLRKIPWIIGLDPENQDMAYKELGAYLIGSFGSAQRLDYGTGHELSFLAFLGCVWKIGGFDEHVFGYEERSIVLGIIEPYLELVRDLILTYTLEPAGSHGVWGLDDHSFLPYVFGSAQLGPPVAQEADLPNEGSLDGAPPPSDVTKQAAVARHRKTNMYFSAIGFIYDVKKGPFWEHSPTLYDISGIKDGWAKINKGMVKMYNAEVLSKFPVVQHFPFGSLFRWERDPNARAPPPSTHVTSQPSAAAPPSMDAPAAMRTPYMPTARPAAPSMPGTGAPWAQAPPTAMPVTGAPWAQTPPTAVPGTGVPWTQAPPTAMPFPRPTSGVGPMSAPPPTTRYAPSATAQPGPGAANMQSANPHDARGTDGPPMTKAPWAR